MSHSAGAIHVIPVDPSLTPEEAWKELCIFGRRVTWTGTETWADVQCDGLECLSIEGTPNRDSAT